MLRINLLPREVLERRRYEGWYRWVAILAIGLILIVLGIYVLLLLEANSKAGQLQQVQENAKQFSATAQTLSIFENKEQELVKREGVAQVALAGRINMGEIANEISLVLPDEVWLDGLTINESTGLVLTANTPRSSSESMDIAYKSVAKTLVRINELPDIIDVWLTTAANTQWGKWAPKPQSATSAPPPLPVNVVGFQASGKVLRPIVATATAPAPAPAPVPVPAPTSGTTQ